MIKDRATSRPPLGPVMTGQILTAVFGGDTASIPSVLTPINFGLEPFILQPPVDQGDGDPEADNLTRSETDVYDVVDVFERFADHYLITVDANDPGTSPTVDPRCELRGLTTYAAQDARSFRADTEILSCLDGSTPVSSSSSRVDVIQFYNEDISNPDIAIATRIDDPLADFWISIKFRPTNNGASVTYNVNTGLTVDAAGAHPRIPIRVDRYADRFEVYWGTNVDGLTPDWVSGVDSTESFVRTASDGGYHVKFGAYFHPDTMAATTRLRLKLYNTSYAQAVPLVVVAPSNDSQAPDLTGKRGVAFTSYDMSQHFSGDTLTFSVAGTGDPLPTGLSLSAAGVLSGTPTEATNLQTPPVIEIAATNSVGTASMTVNLEITAPTVLNLGVAGDQLNFDLTATDGTAYVWFGTDFGPSDTDIINGAGSGFLAGTSMAVTVSGATVLDFDTSAYPNVSGYLYVIHVSPTEGTSAPVFIQVDTPAVAATVPDTMVAANYDANDGTGPGEIELVLNSLPANGGATITNVQYQVDTAGPWRSLPSYGGTGTYILTDGITAGATHNIRCRAVNSEGNGLSGPNDSAVAGSAAASVTWGGWGTPAAVNFDNTMTVSAPAGRSAGDMLVLLPAVDGADAITIPGEWTLMGSDAQSAAVSGAVYYKIAAGDGTDDVTIDTTDTTNEAFSAVMGYIPGAGNISGTFANNVGFDVPAHTPASNGLVWIAIAASDSNDAVTAAPTNFTDFVSHSSGTTAAATISAAVYEADLATLDPGIFSGGGGEQHVTALVALWA